LYCYVQYLHFTDQKKKEIKGKQNNTNFINNHPGGKEATNPPIKTKRECVQTKLLAPE
jgi:hypothetical protein